MVKLSIIIVNYNVQHFLEQCLYAIYKAAKNIDVEVWVVDNCSVDGSVKMLKEKFPQVKRIENKKNVGFSAANNQAIKQAAGQYILLLNPDTVVGEETFFKTLSFMDAHPEAGALGVKMIDGTGHFLPESKRALPTAEVAFYKIFGLSALFPKSKRFGRYHLTYLPTDKVAQVDVLSGAFMLLRKATLNKTGLLDEDFFMYGEDIDISYRITQAGYKNVYYPETRIIHYKGESTKKGSINYVLIFYNAMRIFAQKHFSDKNARLLSLFINTAIFFRASIAILHRFIKRTAIPVADFIIIYAGYYFISQFYARIKFSVHTYYSAYFLMVILPVYILIWMGGILLSGGYDKPVKEWKVIRGALWGTAIILILYALLPEDKRFSRALILIGAAWVLLALTLWRQLLRIARPDWFGKDVSRILIMGKDDECKRVHSLLSKAGMKIEAVQYLNPENIAMPNGDTINVWQEKIRVYNITEVIFCAKDISSQLIMDAMSSIPQEVEFKIAPPESWAVIGSNSVYKSGELYIIDVHAINTASNIRNKRMLDLCCGCLLLLLGPVLVWIQKKPDGYFLNTFSVLIGTKSWVGYSVSLHDETIYRHLPVIKSGVLSPINASFSVGMNTEAIEAANAIYARDYKILTDIKIIWNGLRNLGNKASKI